MSMRKIGRVGLRLVELEAGLAENVESNSPELVDYETTRTHGQAMRIAMTVRGQDVIEDETLLKKVVTSELQITPQEYQSAKRLLQELDILEERIILGRSVLVEKVQRLDHAANYERLGESWTSSRGRSAKEEALVYCLDAVISTPGVMEDIDALADLSDEDVDAVIELGKSAAVLDTVSDEILYSPLLWDVDPNRLAQVAGVLDRTEFKTHIDKIMKRPGTTIDPNTDPIAAQIVSAGILPTFSVKSSGKEKSYSFAPYSGSILSSPAQKLVLEKARAIVACLRFGSEEAVITRIKDPAAIIRQLLDSGHNHRLGEHSELKQQYGMLVKKGVGRIERTSNGRFTFALIPTEDNLLACGLAREFITSGEVLSHKDPSTAQAAIHLVSGNISHPIREVKVARKKRPARADDLASLVEAVRQVK